MTLQGNKAGLASVTEMRKPRSVVVVAAPASVSLQGMILGVKLLPSLKLSKSRFLWQ